MGPTTSRTAGLGVDRALRTLPSRPNTGRARIREEYWGTDGINAQRCRAYGLGPASDSMLIVIVDDEDSVRTGLRRLCVSLGLRASVYASGSDFLHSLAAGTPPPDCVLLDAHMPHISGL